MRFTSWSTGPGFGFWLRRDLSLAVGTEGLNHTVHIAEKSRNVCRIQDCSVGKAGGTQSSDISGSNLTGIARYFFRETQQLFKLRINRSSAIIGHQRIC